MRELTRKNGHASLQRVLRGYWNELLAAGSAFDVTALEEAARLLLACQARGGTVFAAGNGGSASTASHMVCDLLKGTRAGGPPTFRAVALTDNMALMTAWANDDAFERVFAEQFVALAKPGDLLIAISASGNSPNVLALVEAARQADVVTIGITGRDGGNLAGMVDLAVRSPADRIEVVEDLHLIVAHSLCVTVRERLRVGGDAVVSVRSVAPAASSAA